MKRICNIIILLSFSLVLNATETRKVVELRDWMFAKAGGEMNPVRIPHDWAIDGPFDKNIDKQVVAIEQNGEKVATEKTGRTGSLPWIGEGEYKTIFTVPDGYSQTEILFDGVMSEPEVFLNGKKIGEWKNGYNAFHFNLTPFIIKGENQLLVKCKNRPESSRWYPGAGIYRPVKLIFRKSDTNIKTWGTYSYTKEIKKNKAFLHYETKLEGSLKFSTKSKENLKLEVSIIDSNNKVVAKKKLNVLSDSIGTTIEIKNPNLWSPESPYLYKLRTQLVDKKGTIFDEDIQIIGIKTVSVTKEHGFQLNGKTRKIKGVCLHHDLGPLGTAINKAALIRQVKILKDMGCDAIRTSHNMPSTMQMEVYDSLGMMVMAESFDMWKYPKCKNGYCLYFDEWSDRDIENLVLNHRNHASNIMWCVGNEIPEQGDKKAVPILKHLQDIYHRLDPSRQVTSGMDRSTAAIKSGFAAALDIPGYNYRLPKYDEAHKLMPQGFLLGSETASTISSRGVYKYPVEKYKNKQYPDLQCSSYDLECCSWSNLPDDDWYWQDTKDWVIGEFVWTGFDYLGEPTPYDDFWPSRSSYFGICDLAGLPKDRYYLYRSRWNQNETTIHLLPHWSFGKEQEGKITPVFCYTNYPSAELFVNGKSQGLRTKQCIENKESMERYRLCWNNVVYEPGEIKVVVYDDEAKVCGEEVVKTAGTPSQLRLKADKTTLSADGDDLSFITVEMTDKDGNLCPLANDELYFSVDGVGEYVAACNGDATSTESFTQPQMKLFNGKLVLIVRSVKEKSGQINVTVKSSNQIISTLSLTSKL